MNRDRGRPHDLRPPTPPYVRVRIRRFMKPCQRVDAGFLRGLRAQAFRKKRFGIATFIGFILDMADGPFREAAKIRTSFPETPIATRFLYRVWQFLIHCFAMKHRRRLRIQLSRSGNVVEVSTMRIILHPASQVDVESCCIIWSRETPRDRRDRTLMRYFTAPGAPWEKA